MKYYIKREFDTFCVGNSRNLVSLKPPGKTDGKKEHVTRSVYVTPFSSLSPSTTVNGS